MKKILLAVTAISSLIAMIFMGLAPGIASADEYANGGAQSWGEKDHKAGNITMGIHNMTGTIETVDPKTGWMKLKTGMGELTIHYPAPSVKGLKPGDNITVHLSYSKDADTMKDDGMMKSDLMKK